MKPLFPNHKPEDADLSNIPGYKGHPGQERVKTVKQEKIVDKEIVTTEELKKEKAVEKPKEIS